jgi:rubrerythrin
LAEDGASLDDEFVEFVGAGEAAKGEFHCADCGYGVTVHSTLPTCPMCAGSSWQRVAWSPIGRAVQAAQSL